jgi:hypothetical protein
MTFRFAILCSALALGGCVAGSYCEGTQDYQRAKSVPPLQPAEGIKVPESEGALRIPPPPANSVPYGELARDEDGDEYVRCLDKPPEVPPPAPEPAAEPAAPAPAAPAPAPEKSG